MTISFEERLSESPYLETVTRGYTECDGSTIRPAESHWHMVLLKLYGKMQLIVVGPLSSSGIVNYGADAELLWIKFKLGTFMPSWPTRNILDNETILPGAANKSFWLNSSTWQFPDYDNVETFVDWLVREEVLVRDPVVSAVLQDEPQDLASRTVRHRFLQSTGLTQNHIHQIERAQKAAALLRHGMPILDTVFEAGYFDQPHLTRALKQWVGYTPAQIIRMSKPDCQILQDIEPVLEYHTNSLRAAR